MVPWRKTVYALLVLIFVLAAALFVFFNTNSGDSAALRYTFSVVNVYPHDTGAFTEGLVFDRGVLYESTGLYGNSSLRHVDLETGEILQSVNLQAEYFGEGIAVVGDKIVQLTWQSHLGFVYDKASLGLLQDFQYPTEGWGLTYDGSRLIMSDGSANLYFLDPVTFQRIRQVEVHDTGPVTELNELEYINGTVYANVWREEKIVVINPQNGQVTAWIDLTDIEDSHQDPNNVLNGIAYDAGGHRLFVTGKMWPHILEINLISLNETRVGVELHDTGVLHFAFTRPARSAREMHQPEITG